MTTKELTARPSAPAPAPAPRKGGRHAARPSITPILTYGAFLVLIEVLVPLDRVWAAQFLLVILLLVVPGVLLLRALRVPGAAVASFPVYVPAASLAVLLASGLMVDAAGPLVGISQPLRPAPALVGIEAVCAALLAASTRAPSWTAIPWDRLTRRPAGLGWPLFLPVLAAAGALRLNNGHGPGLAAAAVCACACVLVWAMAAAPRLHEMTIGVVLYSIALAMMWSFSLRGNLVYGFDISTEYHDMQATLQAGVWHFAHPGDAYGAMLSITVLPGQLHALSGVSGLLILKMVYPALNALFPVAIFSLGRRILSRRWAFAAPAFIIIQLPFSQEMPALARQEIALIFFVALVGALFDTRLARPRQRAMVIVFGLGMVVSHYSTTYFTVALLAPMLVLPRALSRLRGVPRMTGSVAVAFAVCLAGATVWYGPVTHSAGNVSQFVHEAADDGFDFLPNRTAGENLLLSYLEGNNQATLSAARYQQLVDQYYEQRRPFVHALPDSAQARFELRGVAAPVPTVRLSYVRDAISLVGLLVTQLAYLLAGLGTVLAALRRKTPPLARQLALLSAGSLVLLGLIRMSGTIANAYNQERAFVQAMAVVSVTMCWGLQGAAAWLRQRSAVLAIAATVALGVIFINVSGLANAVLGGGTATNLADSGEDFERFYMTAPELTAAAWLGQQVRPGQLVYADRYASLRLAAVNGMAQGVLADITPRTLNRHAWVYASQTNVIDRSARNEFENETVVYAFPIGFLEANFDTVYTDGFSEVFRR
ncbi:MAG: hypothetical protein ACRDOU_28030 [Streptosporangiaceae bacterium]